MKHNLSYYKLDYRELYKYISLSVVFKISSDVSNEILVIDWNSYTIKANISFEIVKYMFFIINFSMSRRGIISMKLIQ